MSVVSGSTSSSQMTLDFEPGLAERHASLLDCVRECTYRQKQPLKTIAADMDLSQSDLSRKLSGNPDDPRRFTLDDLEKWVAATKDTTPILYLVEKYLADAEMRQRAALAELAKIAPQLLALMKAANP